VHGGRRTGEHRREARHGAGRVDGLAVPVAEALGRQPVQEGRVGLGQAVGPAAVDHHQQHLAAGRAAQGGPGRTGTAVGGAAPGGPPRHPGHEAAVDHLPHRPHPAHNDEEEGRRSLRVPHSQEGRHLGHLLEQVARGGVGVLDHQPPEPREVGPGRPQPEVVVDAAPEEHCEQEVEPDGEAGRSHGEPTRHDHDQQAHRPQHRPKVQRVGVAPPHRRQWGGHEDAGEAGPGEDQQEQAEGGGERLALVEHVPHPGRPLLQGTGHPARAGGALVENAVAGPPAPGPPTLGSRGGDRRPGWGLGHSTVNSVLIPSSAWVLSPAVTRHSAR
jgi:hypothetical protein